MRTGAGDLQAGELPLRSAGRGCPAGIGDRFRILASGEFVEQRAGACCSRRLDVVGIVVVGLVRSRAFCGLFARREGRNGVGSNCGNTHGLSFHCEAFCLV